jgi:para-nitrobenzyl esterase
MLQHERMMMRTLMIAALFLAPLSQVHAQAAPNPAPAAGGAERYSTSTTQIGTLLDDPAAKAVIEKHIPGMTTNDQIEMARGMTLKDIQQYSPEAVTDKVLAETDADLAKLPVKPAPPAK